MSIQRDNSYTWSVETRYFCGKSLAVTKQKKGKTVVLSRTTHTIRSRALVYFGSLAEPVLNP